MSIQHNTQGMKSGNDFILIKDMLYLCLSKWKWFVASLAVSLSVAMIYIYLTEPTYIRSTSILLKNTPKEQTVVDEKFGINAFQINTTRNDEIMALQSPLIMEEVVRKLNLEMEYTVKAHLSARTLYGKNLPIQVCFHDSIPADNTTMTLRLTGSNKVEVSDFYSDMTGLTATQSIEGPLSAPITTPIGEITVLPNPGYKGPLPYTGAMIVHRRTVPAMASYFQKCLNVKINDEKSGLINLSIADISPQRAEDVLNTLISAYDVNWMKAQSERTVNTSEFINERLKIIEKDLGNIEDNMSSYKSQNLIPDVSAASGGYMQQFNDASARLLTLNTQQSIIRYVRYCLSDNMERYRMLPATGLENGALEGQISVYNSLLSQRNKLASNGEQHPQVAEAEQSLTSMRSVILESIDNLDASISTQINDLQKNVNQITKQLASSPEQAKHLLSIERQQKVKESLYLFLLQKLEENELSMTNVSSNIRIISPVSGSNIPVTPLKSKSILLAIAIGLFFPIVIIFIIEVSDTMIRNRKDLEYLSLPFVGEVPQAYEKKKFFTRKNKNNSPLIVVTENSHNVVNEAFRIVRTNLNFIWGKEDKSKIIMVTSFLSNSGKSFTSINLAMGFAIQRKKVLVIDLDMRKAIVSKLVNSPQNGVSGYLNNTIDNLEGIIVRGKIHPNLDMIPVGVIPPNPAELLSDERLGQLLDTLRKQYDYIFIDCPPLNIVADSYIINKLVDMTLFVIRAGLLDKSMLQDIEKLYENHQQGRVCVLLNCTTVNKRYGHSRYGYNYGYYVTDYN